MVLRTVLVVMVVICASIRLSAQVFNVFPEPDENNAGIGTGPVPLNRLHIHGRLPNPVAQPVLRFSFQEQDSPLPVVSDNHATSQLALPRNEATVFSREALPGDFVIRTTKDAGRLILSTQRPGSPIVFTSSIIATTPNIPAQDYPLVMISNGTESPARAALPAPPLNSIDGRLITMPGVHLGVECTDPKDAVQVGSRLTLHPGYNFNYIGYNQHTMKVGQNGMLVRSSGLVDAVDNPLANPPIQSGHASGVMFMRGGEAILYSAGEDNVGTPVRVWQEPEWFVRGVSVGPDGLVGVGLIAPRPTSSPVNVPTARLTVRGLLGQQHSYGTGTANTFSMAERPQLYSLRVVTGDGFDLLSAREDRRIGIGNLQPRDILHVGNEIVFHDGGSKGIFINGYYDAVNDVRRNISSTRPTVFIGVDQENQQGYAGGFAISVQKVSTPQGDQEIFGSGFINRGSYRGLRLLPNGSAGIGEFFPEARLDVRGLTGSSMDIFLARSVSTSGPQGFLVVTADGKVGVNTSAPKGAFHVNGNVTIGVNECTNSHPGFTNKLSVDGIIFSKEVRVVPSTWADDVFRANYSLPTLAQVEEHIKEHGRLSGIPSEAQATTEGVDVSVMQAALLRKIEELTLYVIELEKKINALKGE